MIRSNRSTIGLLLAVLLIASVVVSVWLILFDGLGVLQSTLTGINNSVQESNNRLLWLAAYALVCLLSQLLIVPSGSLILMAAGFIFSPLLAAGIFSAAQVVCSWPVYSVGRIVSEKFPQRFSSLSQRFKFATDWEQLVQQESILATVVLRLTPVIPSAAACLLAAGLGLRWSGFIIATIAVCWIRPLFFASLGGSLQALTAIPDAAGGTMAFKPLLLLFIGAVALLLVKVVLRVRGAVR